MYPYLPGDTGTSVDLLAMHFADLTRAFLHFTPAPVPEAAAFIRGGLFLIICLV